MFPDRRTNAPAILGRESAGGQIETAAAIAAAKREISGVAANTAAAAARL